MFFYTVKPSKAKIFVKNLISVNNMASQMMQNDKNIV